MNLRIILVHRSPQPFRIKPYTIPNRVLALSPGDPVNSRPPIPIHWDREEEPSKSADGSIFHGGEGRGDDYSNSSIGPYCSIITRSHYKRIISCWVVIHIIALGGTLSFQDFLVFFTAFSSHFMTASLQPNTNELLLVGEDWILSMIRFWQRQTRWWENSL